MVKKLIKKIKRLAYGEDKVGEGYYQYFNNRRYFAYDGYTNPDTAKKVAKRFRNRGSYARVVKQKEKYIVYVGSFTKTPEGHRLHELEKKRRK